MTHKADANIANNLKEFTDAQLFITETIATSSDLKKGMYWGVASPKAYKEIIKNADAVTELNEMVAEGTLTLTPVKRLDGKDTVYVELDSIETLLNILATVQPEAYESLKAVYEDILKAQAENEKKFMKYLEKLDKKGTRGMSIVLSSSNLSSKSKVGTEEVPAFIVTPKRATELFQSFAFSTVSLTSKNNGLYGTAVF